MNAMFFDVDGTLLDSKTDLALAVNATRRELGLAEVPVESVLPAIGNGVRHLMATAIPEAADRVDELLPLHLKNYRAHLLDTAALYPGVRRTLDELIDRGWLLGVVTNKPGDMTRILLEHFGIARHFGAGVVGGGDCPELKPSALPLREAAARLRGHRLSSHDWMVGDNWTDLQCAANAGVKAAFCTWGYGRPRDERCAMKINRFDEILRFAKPED